MISEEKNSYEIVKQENEVWIWKILYFILLVSNFPVKIFTTSLK